MSDEAVYNEIDPFCARWLRELVDAGHLAAGKIEQTGIEHLQPRHVEHATQAHFFAGVGVWPHALRLAGWPDDRPVWTGSCPCQPFSSAGARGGASDARHLWPAWFSLIRECRPPIIFGEQVASKSGRHWLDAVSADLEALGYAFGAADLCAAGVGAPHIRQRMFWVAISEQDGRERIAATRVHDHREFGDDPHGRGYDDGRGWEWSECSDGRSRPHEPGLVPLVASTPEVLGRLRGYGNAIVAPLAAEFIRAVMA
jgi:DNA (cytosine-5)-methyltransferase 1